MRDASTYQTSRRNEWRRFASKGPAAETWQEFNTKMLRWHIGSFDAPQPAMRDRRIGRSKYVPHQGQREKLRRAKGGPLFDPLWGTLQPAA